MKNLMMTMILALAAALPAACMTDAPQPNDEPGDVAAARIDEASPAPGLEPALAQAADGEAVSSTCEGEYVCPPTDQFWIFTCGLHNAAAAYNACKRACPVTCVRY